MKILYYHLQKNTPMFLWQNDHIVDELKHNNVTIQMFNPLEFSSIEEANIRLVDELKREKYDMFMTCHNEKLLYISTLKEIKRLGLPTLLICFDNLLVPYEHKEICSYFDLVWLTSKENSEMFEKWGAKTIFMPYAANPYFFVPQKEEEILKVAFVGTPYGSRANTINSLLNNEVPVTVFGKVKEDTDKHHVISNGFLYTVKKNLGFSVGRKLLIAAAKQRVSKAATIDLSSEYLQKGEYVENLATVYSKYALSLSSTTARNTGVLKNPVPVVNLRSFEIPMCGGIQFCKYNKELSEYFDDGKEIIFYHDEIEMTEKARFYLAEQNERIRSEIRRAARARAENDHTWNSRFNKIFKQLNIRE